MTYFASLISLNKVNWILYLGVERIPYLGCSAEYILYGSVPNLKSFLGRTTLEVVLGIVLAKNDFYDM